MCERLAAGQNNLGTLSGGSYHMSDKPLVQQQDTSFAEALDEAIALRGVTLTHLHRRLADLATPVSLATLSYWRSGRSEPERRSSIDAVHTLEEVLGVDEGSLVDRLGPPRRSAPPQPEVSVAELSGRDEAVRTALAKLGFTAHDEELSDYAVMLILDLDDRGAARRLRSINTWRARHDGAQRTATVLTMDGEADPPPVFTPAGGFRVGAQVFDPDNRLHVAELLLDRPLARGELAMGEEDIDFGGTPLADDSLSFFATRRTQQIVLWVRFDLARLPAECETVDVIDGVEITSPLSLGGGQTLFRSARGYGPGTIGIRWSW
jgi:hypothetical protein